MIFILTKSSVKLPCQKKIIFLFCSISMSPKNRSKLDKLNRSPRASISEEEENVKNKPQEDIGMLLLKTCVKVQCL